MRVGMGCGHGVAGVVMQMNFEEGGLQALKIIMGVMRQAAGPDTMSWGC